MSPSQPNLPNSPTNPLQNYGISKLISELKVQSHKGDYCIIRTPVLYGEKCKIHENAVTCIAKSVMDLRNISTKEDNFCVRRPLHVRDVSLFILHVIANDCKGIYHFYNPYNRFTKYEMCMKIANILHCPINHIVANNTDKLDCIASRPYDTMLLDDKYNVRDFQFTDFDTSIERYFSKYSHVKPDRDCFLLIDLDGTLIHSSIAHYNAYKDTFKQLGLTFIDEVEWNRIISDGNINTYLYSLYDADTVAKIKSMKKQSMKIQDVTYTNNSDLFLQYLIDNRISFAVVTNTDMETVNILKSKLPVLAKIQNWVTRDDYKEPKPSGECYQLAMSMFYSGEKYIVGIEDSNVGYSAIRNVTERIYVYTEPRSSSYLQDKDCYLFNNYNIFL